MVTAGEVEARLRSELVEADIRVEDLQGCGGWHECVSRIVCARHSGWHPRRPPLQLGGMECPPPSRLPCCRCGTSFEVFVVSSSFEGKRVLERHKLVNAALAPLMPHFHALSIRKAKTPQEEEVLQQQEQGRTQ